MLPLLLAACVDQANGVSSASSAAATVSAASSRPSIEFGDANAISSQAMLKAQVTEIAYAKNQHLGTGGTLLIGKDAAPLTLTVFLNDASPYSKEFMDEDYAPLLRGPVADGSLQLAIIIVPFRKYPNSLFESAALTCAATQGKGREMHETLFAMQNRDKASVLKAAKDLQLDLPSFNSCIVSPDLQQVRAVQDRLIAQNGVTLVPTFLFNGTEKFVGLPEYPDLRGMMETKLAAQKK
jgi:protein-disulfide isomerase